MKPSHHQIGYALILHVAQIGSLNEPLGDRCVESSRERTDARITVVSPDQEYFLSRVTSNLGVQTPFAQKTKDSPKGSCCEQVPEVFGVAQHLVCLFRSGRREYLSTLGVNQ